jgi:hypothetical protein
LAAYKEIPLIETAKKLHEILNRLEFQAQWKALLAFLKRYGSFEEAFNAHLNRHLLHINNFSLKELEEKCVQAVFESSLSFEDAFKTIELQ